MANEFFDVRTSIINKKQMSDESVIKYYSGYVTMRWLMMHHKAVWESNIINSTRGLKYISPLNEYKALKGVINIPRNTFLKTDKIDKNFETVISLLMEKYKIGKSTAEEYYNILGKDRILNFLEKQARKNENYMTAKETEKVKKIREALVAEKRK